MIKVGDLAKQFNINNKTIYFYEKKGLLLPVEVDRFTGYRYYDENSVKKLAEILYLKSLKFSLKEIKNFSKEVVALKTVELKNEAKCIHKNLSVLNSFLKNNIKEGEFKMSVFENDEKAVGKWVKVGIVKNKEQFLSGNIEKDDYVFPLKALYLLPEGKRCWVINGWTKGLINIKNASTKYEILNDHMLIEVTDSKTGKVSDFAVYKKVYSKEFPGNIRIEDNLNIPFITDDEAVGFWTQIDFIDFNFNFDEYNPNETHWKHDKLLKGYDLRPDGTGVVRYNNNNMSELNWSKGVILNPENKTASEYAIKHINNNAYMFVEWKSGDYVFNGEILGRYVLKKLA